MISSLKCGTCMNARQASDGASSLPDLPIISNFLEERTYKTTTAVPFMHPTQHLEFLWREIAIINSYTYTATQYPNSHYYYFYFSSSTNSFPFGFLPEWVSSKWTSGGKAKKPPRCLFSFSNSWELYFFGKQYPVWKIQFIQ